MDERILFPLSFNQGYHGRLAYTRCNRRSDIDRGRPGWLGQERIQGRLMIRLFIGTILLAASTVTGFVQSAGAADDLRSLPMSFDIRSEGMPETCGTKCRSWVSAVGSITSETPRQFENFARTHDVRGGVIAFDSGGGSVLGTLELGRMIRRLDMTTTVGRTATEKGSDSQVILSPRADCESMCAFVLLAGTRRYIPSE